MFGKLLDLLFPPRCVFCGDILTGGAEEVCPKCRKEARFLQGKERHGKGEFFDDCVSVLKYRGCVRRGLLDFKFRRRQSYRHTYGRWMAELAREEYEGELDVVTWVPLSRRSLRKRRYDQCRLLAETVAARLGLPVERLLRKVRETEVQSGLREDAERRANVLGAYAAAGNVAGRRILLVDDVVTSGATLAECARALLTAGAEAVLCVTLCKARDQEK